LCLIVSELAPINASVNKQAKKSKEKQSEIAYNQLFKLCLTGEEFIYSH